GCAVDRKIHSTGVDSRWRRSDCLLPHLLRPPRRVSGDVRRAKAASVAPGMREHGALRSGARLLERADPGPDGEDLAATALQWARFDRVQDATGFRATRDHRTDRWSHQLSE